MRSELRGYALVTGAAVCWGISAVLAKSLFLGGVDPAGLVAVRLSGAFLLLLAALWVSRRRFPAPPARSLPLLAGLGVTLALVTWTYYLAVSLTGVAAAVFLQYQAPVLVAGFGFLTGRDRPGRTRILALALAIAGCYFLATGGRGALAVTPGGLAAGLTSAAFFAGYSLLGERLVARHDALTVLLWALLAGALAWTPVRSPLAVWAAAGASWPGFILVVTAGTLIPFGLYLAGLRTLAAGKATLVAAMEPAVAAVAAFLVLGETLLAGQVAGALLILASVVTLRLEGPSTAAQPQDHPGHAVGPQEVRGGEGHRPAADAIEPR